MIKTLTISMFIFLASSFAWAGETSSDAQQYVFKSEPFGDVDAGKNKASACAACHGRNGSSSIASYPNLAGQGAHYLYKQMKDFQSGAREDAIMKGQVAGFSDQDMKDIAAYFAAQESKSGTVKKELLELGQKIYRGGDAASGLPACIACHGPAGKGMEAAGFPALAGQHAQYTEAQLQAFRAAGRGDHKGKRRTNDRVDGAAAMMQDVAAKMTDDQIQAVSSYINGLR